MSNSQIGNGAIFKNNYKEKDTHPDYRGNGTINGEEVEMACWVKRDKNGNPYFSVAFSTKAEDKATAKPTAKQKEVVQATMDDDLPF